VQGDKDRCLGFLRTAAKKSDLVKLSKCGKYVKRRLPFKYSEAGTGAADKRVLYVENYPEALQSW
jgi:hypothetical protein